MPRESLPAPYRHVDITWLEFHAAGDPSGTLCGDQSRPRSTEWVEHKVTPASAIFDGVHYEVERLYSRMPRKRFIALATESVEAAVIPHVRTVPAEPTELNVIPMRLFTRAEHEHEFVLAPIEGAHATSALYPYTRVEMGEGACAGGFEYLACIPPVHKTVNKRAVVAMKFGKCEKFTEKIDEPRFIHFTGGHLKVGMIGTIND